MQITNAEQEMQRNIQADCEHENAEPEISRILLVSLFIEEPAPNSLLLQVCLKT